MTQEEMKAQLKKAWCEVFDVDDVEEDADFFDEGGDSIKAVQLSAWLIQKGIKLGLGDVFSFPLFSQMAASLKETKPVFVPDQLLTRDMVQKKLSEATGSEVGQPVNPAPVEGNQVHQPAADTAKDTDQQICDPANNSQIFDKANSDQICDPAKNDQICDPAKNIQSFDPATIARYISAMKQEKADSASEDDVDSTEMVFKMLKMMISEHETMLKAMISQHETMLEMMNMMISIVSRPSSKTRKASQPEGKKPDFSKMKFPPIQNPGYSKETIEKMKTWMSTYKSREIDKPVEKPNVISLDKKKVGVPEKSAEEVLEYVLSTVLKGKLDRKVDLFAQGLTSLDTVKMVTRCGEYGYVLNMQDIYLHSFFDELVQCMTPGE